MNNTGLSYFLRFLLIMLLQILIFNNLNIFGYVNPIILIYFILIIPFETPSWLYMLIAFACGIVQDSFVNSGGIYAASFTLIAFVRPLLLRIIASRRSFESGIYPSVKDLGWKWFSTYVLVSVFIVSVVIEMLTIFSFSNFQITLLRIAWQCLFTSCFVLLFEFVGSLNKKSQV